MVEYGPSLGFYDITHKEVCDLPIDTLLNKMTLFSSEHNWKIPKHLNGNNKISEMCCDVCV